MKFYHDISLGFEATPDNPLIARQLPNGLYRFHATIYNEKADAILIKSVKIGEDLVNDVLLGRTIIPPESGTWIEVTHYKLGELKIDSVKITYLKEESEIEAN